MPKSRFIQRIRNNFNRSKGTEVPQIPPLTSPKKPSASSSSKSIKRRRIIRTVADSERKGPAQKTERQEGAVEEEDSELYETPNNN